MRLAHLFIPILSCALLIGCQANQDKELPAGKPINTEKADKPKKTESAETSYSIVGEEIEQEPGGLLFKKHLDGKELAGKEEYETAADEAVNEYVNNIEAKDASDWDAERWARSLVTNLRSDHSATIQPIKDFSVLYDKLKLPDGRLLQDVTEEELNEKAYPVNVAILLDASGSMKADVAGGNKMELAKSSLKRFSESLPENVHVSLSVFGHKGTGSDADKGLSCSSIETVYPLKSYNQDEFSSAMNQFQASGWTPLAAAIQKAEKDLTTTAEKTKKTFIYIISDGIETCDGNPVEAAKSAKKSVTGLQINIIGFDVDDEANRQLKEVAKEGGGEYSTAQSKQQLDELITKTWRENIGEVTWMFWGVHNHNDINWASVAMSNKLRDLQNNEITARNRESERMNAALNQLSEAGIIENEVKTKVRDLLFERTNAIKTYADQLVSKKHEEIFETADQLRDIIDKTMSDQAQ